MDILLDISHCKTYIMANIYTYEGVHLTRCDHKKKNYAEPWCRHTSRDESNQGR